MGRNIMKMGMVSPYLSGECEETKTIFEIATSGMLSTSTIFCLNFLFLSSHPSSNTFSQSDGHTLFDSSNPASVGSNPTLGYISELYYVSLCR
jgi:hypothetical protein